ncbi:MAG: hypothetical protein NZ602_04720 [Thermoguttaceae bacterium]|nr:hypothetical protein [Thermoguttaceae bacterium]MDW8037338.1 hypothetical protein [Thermoguttaceae bacterium]
MTVAHSEQQVHYLVAGVCAIPIIFPHKPIKRKAPGAADTRPRG